MFIIGHRGARAIRPENTIAALQEGGRCAEYVEIDVRISRDGVPVVIHDLTLDRTTDGTGLVSAYSLSELRLLDAGEGEVIPTLASVLALDLGDCGLVIELKEGGYEDLIAGMVQESGHTKVMIVSFDPDRLRRIAPLLPDARIGYIFGSMEGDPIRVASSIPAAAILPRSDLVTDDLVAAAHGAGLLVIGWTLNTDEEFAGAVLLGIDGVASDDPCRARQYYDGGGMR
ncbi:glycerophosphodiester phosphodiesterase [Methanocalculus chunghsingensis]|uniref:Glycerophosphodiester phosphodiesterase n=1 Tax=Methanocalculus chunghsingensis TaxID=156457 RepID=A0A8J7WBB3_9EURY|nr:glycerophosphodiester phosphodiesterase family protein [Methanocalculus chunghsingensis]MBR1369588.1 glycerophosphodiester phosphodiesterase [Methanocalculus chunghsingensis]